MSSYNNVEGYFIITGTNSFTTSSIGRRSQQFQNNKNFRHVVTQKCAESLKLIRLSSTDNLTEYDGK